MTCFWKAISVHANSYNMSWFVFNKRHSAENKVHAGCKGFWGGKTKPALQSQWRNLFVFRNQVLWCNALCGRVLNWISCCGLQMLTTISLGHWCNTHVDRTRCLVLLIILLRPLAWSTDLQMPILLQSRCISRFGQFQSTVSSWSDLASSRDDISVRGHAIYARRHCARTCAAQ